MPTLEFVTRRGTRAAQPAATMVSIGTLYFVTDEGVTERSNRVVWEPYSDATMLRDLQHQIDELRARLDAL
jgi:hypothetical protein